MYFSETPSLREIEKTMKMIPNFTPRGHGVVGYKEQSYFTACFKREFGITPLKYRALNNHIFGEKISFDQTH